MEIEFATPRHRHHRISGSDTFHKGDIALGVAVDMQFQLGVDSALYLGVTNFDFNFFLRRLHLQLPYHRVW